MDSILFNPKLKPIVTFGTTIKHNGPNYLLWARAMCCFMGSHGED